MLDGPAQEETPFLAQHVFLSVETAFFEEKKLVMMDQMIFSELLQIAKTSDRDSIVILTLLDFLKV